jgi:hypothetical protein
MRAEYTLALRRESVELERSVVDQRIDEAYEKVYEYLEPAANHLRSLLCEEGRRALAQMERAYQQAIEHAARSGIGCQPNRRPTLPQAERAPIPASIALPEPALFNDPDRVLHVRPCS